MAPQQSPSAAAAAAADEVHGDLPIQPLDTDTNTREPPCPVWTRFTEWLHDGISGGVTTCALHAAKFPKTYIGVISTVSLLLIALGLATNFRLVLDMDVILTPVNSKPQLHAEWIASKEEPFGVNPVRLLQMVFHADGQNVLHPAQTRRVLEAVHQIRTTPGYDELCQQGVYVNFQGDKTCRIFSVSGFWEDHSLEVFDNQMQRMNNTTTDDATTLLLRDTLSHSQFADGSPVLHDTIVGNYQWSIDTNTLVSAQSYLLRLELPDTDDTNRLEGDLLKRLDQLRRDWKQLDNDANHDKPHHLTMDFVTVYAYQLEFLRAVLGDLYLIALSALIMVGFTCAVFYRRSNDSRMLLGVASVLTIGCSILTGNGLMFLLGIPYSLVHQMLPFVVFGIGLDDTFIITGAYLRTPSVMPLEDRIRQTMHEVGWSIFVTTLTTLFAFTLGYVSSSFPGVHWLCLYAVVTIGIDFFYQITYFVAWLVLDERRLQDNRKDCFFWVSRDEIEDGDGVDENEGAEKQTDGAADAERDDQQTVQCPTNTASANVDKQQATSADDDDDNDDLETSNASDAANAPEYTMGSDPPEGDNDDEANPHPEAVAAPPDNETPPIIDNRPLPERIMSWYADVLLYPRTKALVLVVFGAFFGYCCWSCTQLTQEFDVGSYVMEDSYLRNVFGSLSEYSTVVRPMAVYFRNVDQSSPAIQQQMIDYVEAMEALPQLLSLEEDFDTTAITTNLTTGDVTGGVSQVRPFCWVRDFQQLDQFLVDQPLLLKTFQNMTFNQQLEFALSDKILREVYGQDIVRDNDGNILASRCFLFIKDLDLKDVEAQIEMLFDQRHVTEDQPINQMEEHQQEWAFFAYDEMFGYWEAFSVSVDELIFTMIAGIIAVSIISFVFIPHWTGVLLICPLIVVLYVNMLGSLHNLGLHINGITYICVVVSIGLLVDFLIHVLLRYYECSPGMTRDERVKETLETMGASILVGGATTFLAVVPLALSSVKIFMTVFNAFFAMVTLGCTHGLILLPVLLSLFGPTTNVRSRRRNNDGDGSEEESPTAKVLQHSPSSGLTIALSSSYGEQTDSDLHVSPLNVIEEASRHSEEGGGVEEEEHLEDVSHGSLSEVKPEDLYEI